jgi:hypothetical protein
MYILFVYFLLLLLFVRTYHFSILFSIYSMSKKLDADVKMYGSVTINAK